MGVGLGSALLLVTTLWAEMVPGSGGLSAGCMPSARCTFIRRSHGAGADQGGVGEEGYQTSMIFLKLVRRREVGHGFSGGTPRISTVPRWALRLRGGWGIDNEKYYTILGLKQDSFPSQDEIKKAYKKQALKLHPDKQPSKNKATAQAKFQELSEAYEVLGDPKRRRDYDRFGKAAPAGSGAQPSEAWDDTEFAYDSRNAGRWGNFFGGKPGGVPNFSRFSMGAVDPQTVGSDIKKSLWLTLEELFEGGLKQVQVQVFVYDPRTGFAVPVERTLSVHVRRGWKDGTKLTFRSPEDLHGVVVTVREKKHKLFRRRGDDLVVRCVLTRREGKFGTNATVPCLGGGSIMLSIKPNSTMVHDVGRKVISREGMPTRSEGLRGNLIVEFEVQGWFRRRVVNPAAKAVVFGGKAAAAGGVAFLVLGKPLRTLRWAWTIVSRLALFAGLMATYM